jgi:hypothetical protein
MSTIFHEICNIAKKSLPLIGTALEIVEGDKEE